MVANFRTEESQRRLLTAVIAAHPELKLNFKDIAGYFGDSTPDGIQWQFRGIKREAEAMRQGKGAAAPGAGPASNNNNGPPVTPKPGRKRVAATAPSTGRRSTTASNKKARSSTSKPVPAAAPVITVEDDDEDDGEEEEDNLLKPIPLDTPTQSGPRFTDFGARQFFGTTDAHQAPALDTTQAETPKTEEEEEGDFKPPHTPSDAAAFSFSQAASSSSLSYGGGYNLDTHPISQPSFHAGPGYNTTKAQIWQDEYVDDEV